MFLSHGWRERKAKLAGACSRRPTWRPACEALESRQLPSTASSLIIDGKPIVQTKANYLTLIKYLTVNPSNQSNPVFRSSNMAAIERLEDPLRREIFDAMSSNPVRTFHFTNLAAAEKNFQMRIDIITFMNEVADQDNPAVNKLHLNFSYYSLPGDPPSANSAYWNLVPLPSGSTRLTSLEFQYVGADAYAAIMSITAVPYVGECEGTAQIAVLYAAAQVMGPQAFNQLFRTGLAFGSQQPGQPALSVYKVLPMDQQLYVPNPYQGYIHVNSITTQDMVPGDWVYMQNTPQYPVQNPNGYWNGENAIYMGQYDSILNGTPVWQVGATQRFTGLGLTNVSAAQLEQDLWDAFTGNDSPVPAGSGIRWTIDVGPGTTSY